MAAYPSYGILLESSQTLESGWLDDFAEAGVHFSRQLHSAQYYMFTLRHQLTAAQWSSLTSTYATGPRDTYTLTYRQDTSPLETYSVKFYEPPQIVDNLGGNRYVVQTRLRGTRD